MKTKTTVILAISVFIVAVVYIVYAGIIEYQKNPLLSENNLDQSYQIYFTGNPLIDERLYEGQENAPISIVAIIDTTSESSKQFYETTIKTIRDTYVDDGQVKIYYKYYITEEDISLETDRYIKTKNIYCYKEAEGKNIQQIHQKTILENNIKTIDTENLDIKYEKFRTCINEPETQQMIEDMVESIQYRIQAPSLIIGINGQDNVVLYGQPTDEILRSTIRNQQIKLGI